MIFVTGGTGLVGSHLLFNLAGSGARVRALKRPGSDTNTVKGIFRCYASEADSEQLFKSIEWVDGDLLDIHSLNKAMDGAETVYHAAAMVAFNPAGHRQMMKINAGGTANVMNTALLKEVKKVCHVSSVAALGRTTAQEIITEESHWRTSAENTYYSVTKYSAEREVWRASQEGLNVVVINPSVVIGPGDWGRSSGNIIKQAAKGLNFYPSGTSGFVDVRDVVKAMIALTESPISHERFIVSSENLSYQTLFEAIYGCLNKKKPAHKATPFLTELAWRAEKIRCAINGRTPLITKETARLSHQRHSYSNEKIKKATGMEFIPMQKSIEDTCRFFLNGK